MLGLALLLETIATLGISAGFISYYLMLSSALWLSQSEGHAFFSMKSYVYQSNTDWFYFKGHSVNSKD